MGKLTMQLAPWSCEKYASHNYHDLGREVGIRRYLPCHLQYNLRISASDSSDRQLSRPGSARPIGRRHVYCFLVSKASLKF